MAQYGPPRPPNWLSHAPPRTQLSSNKRTYIEAFATSQEKTTAMIDQANRSIFFDYGAPKERRRRDIARSEFEFLIEVLEGRREMPLEELWNADHFVERTKYCLTVAADGAKGKIGEKPRADILWKLKSALSWWAVRIIPQFPAILLWWNLQIDAHIHLVAVEAGLETRHYQKNNLTDAELLIFFRCIQTMDRGITNWKQHYAAWLFSYGTAARPSSITVAPGYEKGAALSNAPDPPLRAEDETLRWFDVTFARFERGIGVKIVLRYLKSERDPYAQHHSTAFSQIILSFPPLLKGPFELDLSAVLLGLAFERKLFGSRSVDDILQGQDKFIHKDSTVNKQAVFVMATQSDELDVATPMRIAALNPKLRAMCDMVGLLKRNTMYGFRRGALVDTRRKAGTEEARKLAGHKPGSRTIEYYDHESLADIDMNALRNHAKGMSREDLRRFFGQAQDQAAHGEVPQEPRGTLLPERDELLKMDPEYIDSEKRLRELLRKVSTSLGKPDVGYTKNIVEELHRELNVKGEKNEEFFKLREELAEFMSKRKQLHRALRKKHLDTVRVQYAEGARTQADDDDDLPPDEDLAEDAADCERTAPPQWSPFTSLPEGTEIEVQQEEDDHGKGTSQDRNKFLKQWIGMKSLNLNKIPCPLCQVDITATDADRTKLWTLNRLDEHMLSKIHSKHRTVFRAYDRALESGALMTCPICPKTSFGNKDSFRRHMRSLHPDIIYEGSETAD